MIADTMRQVPDVTRLSVAASYSQKRNSVRRRPRQSICRASVSPRSVVANKKLYKQPIISSAHLRFILTHGSNPAHYVYVLYPPTHRRRVRMKPTNKKNAFSRVLWSCAAPHNKSGYIHSSNIMWRYKCRMLGLFGFSG